LPDLKHLQWLSFILALSNTLCLGEGDAHAYYEYVEPRTLRIFADSDLYLAKENISKLHKPESLEIEFIRER